MPRFLNSSIVNPSESSVSIKSTGIRMGLALPLSLKNMLQQRDKSRVRRYGICICTFPEDIALTPAVPGVPRGTNMDAGWYDRLFTIVRV